MASQMPRDVEARIRALPGNNVCCDCSHPNPQWASVSYGCLMCLECSGHHRSLGVHLSFIRSLAMDSWTERQLAAMEKSGGNKSLVDYLASRNVQKDMQISVKYSNPQAKYYRDRLTRWLDGKTEPPPDPGRYDPATGLGDAQGAEPIPGETTEAYNARQARLREAARERMRAKFGNNGFVGGGAGSQQPQESDEGLRAMLGGAVSGVGSFLKDKVIDNDGVRGVAGNVFEGLKSNASLEEDSIAKKGLGLLGGVAGSLRRKVSGVNQTPDEIRCRAGPEVSWSGDGQGAPADELDDEAFFAQIGQKSNGTRTETQNGNRANSFSNGTGAGVQAQKPSHDAFKSDDNWGDWDSSKPTRAKTEGDVTRLAKAMESTKLGSGYEAKPAPVAPAPSEVKRAPSPTAVVAPPSANPSPPKKQIAKLAPSEDFFGEFGLD